MAQTLPKDVLNLPMFERKLLGRIKGCSGSVWMKYFNCEWGGEKNLNAW